METLQRVSRIALAEHNYPRFGYQHTTLLNQETGNKWGSIEKGQSAGSYVHTQTGIIIIIIIIIIMMIIICTFIFIYTKT